MRPSLILPGQLFADRYAGPLPIAKLLKKRRYRQIRGGARSPNGEISPRGRVWSRELIEIRWIHLLKWVGLERRRENMMARTAGASEIGIPFSNHTPFGTCSFEPVCCRFGRLNSTSEPQGCSVSVRLLFNPQPWQLLFINSLCGPKSNRVGLRSGIKHDYLVTWNPILARRAVSG